MFQVPAVPSSRVPSSRFIGNLNKNRLNREPLEPGTENPEPGTGTGNRELGTLN